MTSKPKLTKPFKFASQKKIALLHDEVKHFVANVLRYDIDGIFISDGSELYDFIDIIDGSQEQPMRKVVEKIKKIYKIDVSKVKNKPIVEIVQYMKEKKVTFPREARIHEAETSKQPHNDLKNPYIWAIGIASLFFPLLMCAIFGNNFFDKTSFIVGLLVLTGLIAVTYYILWTLYLKSSDYHRRYKSR